MPRIIDNVARLAALAGVLAAPALAATVEERRQYLEDLRAILPENRAFEEWLAKTGELPPDFDALPRNNSLPDPLRFYDGRRVTTPLHWRVRRAEILDLFQRYLLGAVPPRPKIARVVPVEEAPGRGAVSRQVRLEFGGGSSLGVELLVPSGRGPFPVFLTPGSRSWAEVALRRGYIGVIYSGSDRQDDATAIAAALYPDYDFSQLAKRAWAGSIALDYVQTLPEADMRHVGISGHSRDGKQALIAGAFDERITAVIPSSSGAGGVIPYLHGGERGRTEGIEMLSRSFPDWFHLRSRFFVGREDRLPVDQNLLVAAVAPRSMLISYAINDLVSDAWSDEEVYKSALPVYDMLGVSERLGVKWRLGGHGIPMTDIEDYFDWFDIQFGRSQEKWRNDLIHDYSWEKWREASGAALDASSLPPRSADLLENGKIATPAAWREKAEGIRETVWAMLGERPPEVAPAPLPAFFRNRPPPEDLTSENLRNGGFYGWREVEAPLAAAERLVRFGQARTGDFFYPSAAKEGERLPAVVFLPSFASPSGYWWGYRRDLNPILGMVQAGYAVFAYDSIGSGKRVLEVKDFWRRHPRWSQLGVMIDDTIAATDWLRENPRVDPERIYLFGHSHGGALALYTAALDERVKGVVSIAGFTPMRTDTAERGAGGVARYSHERAFLPKLGFYVGEEGKLPYDFPELIAAIAPRPVLVVQPKLDRDAHPEDVREAVSTAGKVYALHDAAGKLALQEPWDYNRLSEELQQSIIMGWMRANLR